MWTLEGVVQWFEWFAYGAGEFVFVALMLVCVALGFVLGMFAVIVPHRLRRRRAAGADRAARIRQAGARLAPNGGRTAFAGGDDGSPVEAGMAGHASEDREYLRRMPYEEYMKTEHWGRVRRMALIRADHHCQLCGQRSGRLEVHHNTYDRRGYEAPSDVIVLCTKCHEAYHWIMRGEKRREH